MATAAEFGSPDPRRIASRPALASVLWIVLGGRVDVTVIVCASRLILRAVMPARVHDQDCAMNILRGLDCKIGTIESQLKLEKDMTKQYLTETVQNDN